MNQKAKPWAELVIDCTSSKSQISSLKHGLGGGNVSGQRAVGRDEESDARSGTPDDAYQPRDEVGAAHAVLIAVARSVGLGKELCHAVPKTAAMMRASGLHHVCFTRFWFKRALHAGLKVVLIGSKL